MEESADMSEAITIDELVDECNNQARKRGRQKLRSESSESEDECK